MNEPFCENTNGKWECGVRDESGHMWICCNCTKSIKYKKENDELIKNWNKK